MPRTPPRNARSRGTARPTPLRSLLRDVLPIPTASYEEHRVLAYLAQFAAERGLDFRQDPFGNAYITYRHGRRPRAARPLVLEAHTDHPGFVVSAVRGRRLDLTFRGGIAAEYGKGEPLRIYPRLDPAPEDGPSNTAPASGLPDGLRATITSITPTKPPRRGLPRRIAAAKALLDASPSEGAEGVTISEGDLALWDLPGCTFRGKLVHARQCDDLAGAVTVLATLDRLAAARETAHVIGLFTRAEEVGLEGAAASAAARELPEDALVVALETSSSAGGRAQQGAGPIIRVGDRAHIFSPAMTMWMVHLAEQLGGEPGPRGFPYQRKLMDAGGTEATAFDLLGYETGAACLALGNWHNAGPNARIRPETVHLDDLQGLITLCHRMATQTHTFPHTLEAARTRWRQIGQAAATHLKSTR